MNKELRDFLTQNKDLIIAASFDSICKRKLNYYGNNEKEDTLHKLKSLLEVIVRCIENNEKSEIVAYIHAISKERYKNGYILFEIQTVINYIEENIWNLLQQSSIGHKVEALKLISSYLGVAKQQLASDFIKYSKKNPA